MGVWLMRPGARDRWFLTVACMINPQHREVLGGVDDDPTSGFGDSEDGPWLQGVPGMSSRKGRPAAAPDAIEGRSPLNLYSSFAIGFMDGEFLYRVAELLILGYDLAGAACFTVGRCCVEH